MPRIFSALFFVFLWALSLGTTPIAQAQSSIDEIFETHADIIIKSSRRTISPAIDAFRDSKLEGAQAVLEAWREKEIWVHKTDKTFFKVATEDKKTYQLFNIVTGEPRGEAAKKDLKQIKPNSGIRGLISSALVAFQLNDPDPSIRKEALESIQRDPEKSHLSVLRASIDKETDAALKSEKQRLARLLTIQFAEATKDRVEAILAVSDDLSIDVRAALNPILDTEIGAYPSVPEGNIAQRLVVGEDISTADAYGLLVAQGAPELVSDADLKSVLADHIEGGEVGGIPVSALSSLDAREQAYANLAAAGLVPAAPTPREREAVLETHSFYAIYKEPNSDVTDAAQKALSSIRAQVQAYEMVDLSLDALSLASIYFLAAIGLAITFGVMRVINMAHGEFIMMGAYTGFVVQQIIPSYTISIIVALPLAFAITFAAGVTLERLVIRWLYDRPLETLLATFGVSIALQQIAKNVFGTQARPLTSPEWLDGAWDINTVVSISWIRVAIFVLSAVFLLFLYIVLNRTRLGLEVRAVTQNPRMAASMGINPDYIRMMTFGLGSGIAGIAGVAIGLFAKVTSGLGQDYIVQSFMTVVVGGVGNLWGVLAGAGLIGVLQKGIEGLNPSNTLAAQTYMIIFIIIFIQFRPRGMFALKGRVAED